MILEQHYLGCLAHASYFIADERSGSAAVVDPQRDIDRYLEMARDTGTRIEHVVLTHLHADFVAGHLELRERTGAVIHLGARAQAEYDFEGLRDGNVIVLGPGVRIEALETPGHSPESISLLIWEAGAERPVAVLTGDTLFVGDVGRPDLRASLGHAAEELGAMLYDSLHEKLLALPDSTLVYPAHGPGTLCGKALGSETVTTIGAQRAENYALAPMGREEFVRLVTLDQPLAPAYFTYDAVLNGRARPTLAQTLARELRPLDLDAVLDHQRNGAQILDTRPAMQFEAGHLRGSVNVGLDGGYATWCGTVFEPTLPIVVVADPGREEEAILRLGRIGFDTVLGYLVGGLAAIAERPDLVDRVTRLAPDVVAERLRSADPPLLVDVRNTAEHAERSIPGALNIPLARIAAGDRPPAAELVVHCASGYRSAIAVSLLRARGFSNVGDLAGGLAAWDVTGAAPSAV